MASGRTWTTLQSDSWPSCLEPRPMAHSHKGRSETAAQEENTLKSKKAAKEWIRENLSTMFTFRNKAVLCKDQTLPCTLQFQQLKPTKTSCLWEGNQIANYPVAQAWNSHLLGNKQNRKWSQILILTTLSFLNIQIFPILFSWVMILPGHFSDKVSAYHRCFKAQNSLRSTEFITSSFHLSDHCQWTQPGSTRVHMGLGWQC